MTSNQVARTLNQETDRNTRNQHGVVAVVFGCPVDARDEAREHPGNRAVVEPVEEELVTDRQHAYHSHVRAAEQEHPVHVLKVNRRRHVKQVLTVPLKINLFSSLKGCF